MSASLVGYILVGPCDLLANKIETATERLEKLKKVVHSYRVQLEEGVEEIELDPCFIKVLERNGEESGDVDTLLCDWLTDYLSRYDISDIVTFWEKGGQCNDTMYRIISRGKFKDQIVVAAQETWGDAPEGEGYQLCDWADGLELFEALGIA